MNKDFGDSVLGRKIKKYQFFDGLIEFDVENYIYDNWLSSSEYNVYKNSFVKIEELEIELFSKTDKPLNTFNETFKLDNLKFISIYFDISLNSNSDCSFLAAQNPLFDKFYLSLASPKSNNFSIIYGIGGSRFPESVYIHGIWELVSIPIQLIQ